MSDTDTDDLSHPFPGHPDDIDMSRIHTYQDLLEAEGQFPRHPSASLLLHPASLEMREVSQRVDVLIQGIMASVRSRASDAAFLEWAAEILRRLQDLEKLGVEGWKAWLRQRVRMVQMGEGIEAVRDMIMRTRRDVQQGREETSVAGSPGSAPGSASWSGDEDVDGEEEEESTGFENPVSYASDCGSRAELSDGEARRRMKDLQDQLDELDSRVAALGQSGEELSEEEDGQSDDAGERRQIALEKICCDESESEGETYHQYLASTTILKTPTPVAPGISTRQGSTISADMKVRCGSRSTDVEVGSLLSDAQDNGRPAPARHPSISEVQYPPLLIPSGEDTDTREEDASHSKEQDLHWEEEDKERKESLDGLKSMSENSHEDDASTSDYSWMRGGGTNKEAPRPGELACDFKLDCPTSSSSSSAEQRMTKASVLADAFHWMQESLVQQLKANRLEDRIDELEKSNKLAERTILEQENRLRDAVHELGYWKDEVQDAKKRDEFIRQDAELGSETWRTCGEPIRDMEYIQLDATSLFSKAEEQLEEQQMPKEVQHSHGGATIRGGSGGSSQPHLNPFPSQIAEPSEHDVSCTGFYFFPSVSTIVLLTGPHTPFQWDCHTTLADIREVLERRRSAGETHPGLRRVREILEARDELGIPDPDTSDGRMVLISLPPDSNVEYQQPSEDCAKSSIWERIDTFRANAPSPEHGPSEGLDTLNRISKRGGLSARESDKTYSTDCDEGGRRPDVRNLMKTPKGDRYSALKDYCDDYSCCELMDGCSSQRCDVCYTCPPSSMPTSVPPTQADRTLTPPPKILCDEPRHSTPAREPKQTGIDGSHIDVSDGGRHGKGQGCESWMGRLDPRRDRCMFCHLPFEEIDTVQIDEDSDTDAGRSSQEDSGRSTPRTCVHRSSPKLEGPEVLLRGGANTSKYVWTEGTLSEMLPPLLPFKIQLPLTSGPYNAKIVPSVRREVRSLTSRAEELNRILEQSCTCRRPVDYSILPGTSRSHGNILAEPLKLSRPSRRRIRRLELLERAKMSNEEHARHMAKRFRKSSSLWRHEHSDALAYGATKNRAVNDDILNDSCYIVPSPTPERAVSPPLPPHHSLSPSPTVRQFLESGNFCSSMSCEEQLERQVKEGERECKQIPGPRQPWVPRTQAGPSDPKRYAALEAVAGKQKAKLDGEWDSMVRRDCEPKSGNGKKRGGGVWIA